MIVTEDQAKDHWCPFARVTLFVRGDGDKTEPPVGIVGHGSNRLMSDDDEINRRMQMCIDNSGATRCSGSKCMAWRWLGWINKEADGSLEVSQESEGLHIMPFGPTGCQHGCVRVGTCGLAPWTGTRGSA
jgi:hypothetical protein